MEGLSANVDGATALDAQAPDRARAVVPEEVPTRSGRDGMSGTCELRLCKLILAL